MRRPCKQLFFDNCATIWQEDTCSIEEDARAINDFLSSAIISMYSRCGEFEESKREFDRMRRMTREELATALITMYSECHALEEAIALFQKFSQRHLQSKEGGIGVWSAMIAAFVNQELCPYSTA